MKRQEISPRILPSDPFPSVRPPPPKAETVSSEHEPVGNISQSLTAWPLVRAGRKRKAMPTSAPMLK